MKRLIGVCVLLAVGLSTGQAAGTDSTARLKLVVRADSSIQPKIVQHLTAALQSGRGVEVTDEDAAYQMEVFAVDLGESRGFLGQKQSIGLALSVLVTQRSAGCVVVRGHWLEVAPAESLQEVCGKIVATLNSRILAPDRSQAH